MSSLSGSDRIAIGEPFRAWYVYEASGDELGRDVGAVGYYADESTAMLEKKQSNYRLMKQVWLISDSNGKAYVLAPTKTGRPEPIDLDNEHKKQLELIKVRALNKLDPVERKVLGLEAEIVTVVASKDVRPGDMFICPTRWAYFVLSVEGPGDEGEYIITSLVTTHYQFTLEHECWMAHDPNKLFIDHRKDIVFLR